MKSFVVCGLVFVVGCASSRSLDFGPLAEPTDARAATPSLRMRSPDEILRKPELMLEDALALAELFNPELAAERANVSLATAAVWEAKLYPNPSAILEVEDYRTRDKATVGKMERAVGIAIPLPVGGRIRAATDIAETEREIAALNYLWRRREILAGVKQAFIATLAARRNAELSRETRDLARSLHDATEERFKAQAVPEMELLKAAVQLAKAESDLRIAEKEAAVALKTLHARIGNANLTNDRLAGALSSSVALPDLESLRGRIRDAHPLSVAADGGIELAQRQQALARAERIPDIDLEITIGKDPEDATIIEGGLSIPLPIFNRNQAKIAAAEISIRQATLNAEAVRIDLLRRLDETYRDVAAAQDRANVYANEILPKARQALDQTNEGYQLGKFGYLDVLDAQRTLAEAKSAHASAVADLNSSAAELEQLSGVLLESR